MNDIERFVNGMRDRVTIIDGDEPPVCTTCEGRKEIVNASGQLVPCSSCAEGRAILRARVERAVKQAGVPDAYAGMTLAHFDALDRKRKQGKMLAIQVARMAAMLSGAPFALSTAYAYCGVEYPHASDPARRHVALWGVYGTGKTALMAAVANALTDAGMPVLFVRARAMMDSVQAAYKGEETRAAALMRFQSAPVLMIDECSTELAEAADKRDIFEEIMRYRMPREALTMLTMNATPAEFRAAWGERTAEAVEEGAHMIPVGGANLRDKFQIGQEDAF